MPAYKISLMKIHFITPAAILLILALCSWQSTEPLKEWEEFSRLKNKKVLMKWLRISALSICSGEKKISPCNLKLPGAYGRAGLFITLIKNGKVRGCFGAFDHSETDTAILISKYLKGALSYDPRHAPLELYELDETDIIITITSRPEPVENLNNVDITHFGVFIECEGKAGTVLVPAEYKTASRLNRNNRYKNCRLSRFRAVTIREDHR